MDWTSKVREKVTNALLHHQLSWGVTEFAAYASKTKRYLLNIEKNDGTTR